MSRGIKSKAIFGEKGSPPQDESESGDMKNADLFRVVSERLDEQDKRFKEEMGNRFETQDKKFEAFHEDMKNTNQRLEELQFREPSPRLANVGIQEGKSGELEGVTTEAGGRRITPPEPQRQQPLLPSQPPQIRLL